MDSKDGKRKKDKYNDDNYKRKEKSSKKARSRSRSLDDNRERRKRRHSRSKSPNVRSKQERPDFSKNDNDMKKEMPARKAKETDMLNTRTGGAYIPPARLRMMQAQITDKSSIAYQRLAWEALKKSIHGHINKINVGNIGIIIKELLKENIVRGRGLLCRSVIQAQAASPTFTNVYAALVAAVNSRFPNIGELLLKRLVIQFKRGFKRNDKAICISSASFIAHLVNQRVAHEILALELLTLLVETPTDDSVEVAIAFLKECGQKLTEVSSKGVNAIFEMLRNILHEGQLDKRVQYMIEVMFQVWKDGFKDHPALIEELELVPEEEQFTHLMMLDEATDPQDILNVFKFDDKYEENEQKYKTLSKEILGSDAESGEEDGSGESGSEVSDEEEEEGAEGTEQKGVTIIDNTETNLVALRRTIYLTINSSLDFEECAHKLMKMQLKPGQEVELCHMFLDCCAEQRTYEKFYGLLAQRFCNINRIYIGPFEEIFKDSYGTAHRLDTNRLRNVSKFFAHLLFTDSISWEVLECVRLNEEDTTSSSRIYIKILFQELAEYMGLKKLNDRLKDPTLQAAFGGIFPRDNPKNTRFSINFFTSIGLGGLTDELREHLKQMPKNIPPLITEIKLDSSSDSSSSSSDSSSDSSSGDSSSAGEENKKKKDKKKSKNGNKEKATKDDEPRDDKDKGERWGHDGFYDTYGQDAQRHEPRARDEEGFAKPHNRSRGDQDKRNGEESSRDAVRDNRRREDRTEVDNRFQDRNGDKRKENIDYRRKADRNYDEKRDERNNRGREVNIDHRRKEDRSDDERQKDKRYDEKRNEDFRRDDKYSNSRRNEDKTKSDRVREDRNDDSRRRGDRKNEEYDKRREHQSSDSRRNDNNESYRRQNKRTNIDEIENENYEQRRDNSKRRDDENGDLRKSRGREDDEKRIEKNDSRSRDSRNNDRKTRDEHNSKREDKHSDFKSRDKLYDTINIEKDNQSQKEKRDNKDKQNDEDSQNKTKKSKKKNTRTADDGWDIQSYGNKGNVQSKDKIPGKLNKKKNKKNHKGKAHSSSSDSSSSSSSESESENSEEEKARKRKKNKNKLKDRDNKNYEDKVNKCSLKKKKSKDDSSSESKDSSPEKEKLGRYWDSYTAEKPQEKSRGRKKERKIA